MSIRIRAAGGTSERLDILCEAALIVTIGPSKKSALAYVWRGGPPERVALLPEIYFTRLEQDGTLGRVLAEAFLRASPEVRREVSRTLYASLFRGENP